MDTATSCRRQDGSEEKTTMASSALFAKPVPDLLVLYKTAPKLSNLQKRPPESDPAYLQSGPSPFNGSQIGHKLCNLQG
ncbi:hypothetical protein Bca4012_020315 [Brassica carinata]